MSSFLSSSLLQNLGGAIVHSLWQFALLWLVYVGVNAVLKLSAHQKYVAAAVAQLAGFSWFVGSLFWGKNEVGLGVPVSAEKVWGSGMFLRGYSLIKMVEGLLPVVAVAYLCVLVFLLAKWVRAYRSVRHIRSEGLVKAGVEWRLFVQKIAAQMGIKKRVGVYFSQLVVSPLTVGFVKPMILLPLACLNNLSMVQMETVLLHELAHIRRHDYLLHLVLSLTEAVLFFNPFMHLLSRQIKLEREHCCDDWVLQYEYDKTMYAHTLLAIATAAVRPALALYAGDNKLLLGRIKRMMKQENKGRKMKAVWPAVVVLMLFVLPMFTRIVSEQKAVVGVNESERQPVFENIVGVNVKEKGSKESVAVVGKKRVEKRSVLTGVLNNAKGKDVQVVRVNENGEQAFSSNDLVKGVSEVSTSNNAEKVERLRAMIAAVAEQVNEHGDELSANDVGDLKVELQQMMEQLKKAQVELKQGHLLVNNTEVSKLISTVYVLPPSAEQLKKMAEEERVKMDSLPERVVIIELPESVADTGMQHMPTMVKVLKTTRL